MRGQGGFLDEWVKAKIGMRPDETLSAARIRAYQLDKLAEVLAYAAGASPFYRRHLAGCVPNRLDSFADLARLPLTTAEDLKSAGLQMLCVSQSAVGRVVTLDTSGTTGRPKRVFFTPADQALTIDYFKQGMATLTRPGEKVLILLPGERQGGLVDLLARALEELGVEPVRFGIGHTLGDLIAKLADTQAEVAVGIPTHLLAAAKYYARRAPKCPLNLKKLLLATDYVAQAAVNEIGRLWKVEVFRYFGMTELGMGGGIECREHNGYHLFEGDFLFEIVDPLSGTPLPDGECGEVVVTTLTREGMPLIRYRTGDLAWLTREPCACGSVLARLGRVKARREGLIEVGAGHTLSMGDLDELWPALPGVIDLTALLNVGPPTPVLSLTLRTLDKAPDQRLIRGALMTHPALRFLAEQSRLHISTETCVAPAHYRPPAGKRRIMVENTR